MDDKLEITEGIKITDHLKISSRKYLSISHIQSAATFSCHAYQIEKEFKGTFSEELTSEHSAYVTGAIVFSVSSLEAAINELFADTVDNNKGRISKLDSDTRNMMANIWKIKVQGTALFSILQKYQIALVLAQKNQFDLGKKPYQDINLLIKLRNSLIHFEPEWITCPAGDDFGQDDIHKFEKQLKGKFTINPLTGQGNPFYPDKCLSHGCAEWAVKSTINFIDDFFTRIGIEPPYHHIRATLNTK